MNRNLIFTLVLVFAVMLVGCSGRVPPASATNTPEAPETTSVPPTLVPTEIAVPSPTPADKPTAVPAEVPTLTATPEPGSVWGIVDTMLAECAGASESEGSRDRSDQQRAYLTQLWERVGLDHPELPVYSRGVTSVTGFVAVNDGTYPNPFAFVDMPEMTPFSTGPRICEGYTLAYDRSLEENTDGDGILAGDAVLFYEVGGTLPYVLDGELREVHFVFPPVP